MNDERQQRVEYRDALRPLLHKLSLGKEKTFMPIFDPQYGCRYPEAERLLERPHEETVRILNQLVDRGLLCKESVDKLATCPSCGSPHIWLRLLCPSCNSHKVIKNTLMEHVKCGHIGGEDQYAQADRLTCPRCKTHLAEPGSDYRVVGAWFECSKCKKRFTEPKASLRCGKCGKISELTEVTLSECFAYSLKEEVAQIGLQSETTQRLIVEMLKEQGFAVESPGSVPGASGVRHDFDVVASQKPGDDGSLLIDIAVSQDLVDEQAVLTAFAKALDVGPRHCYLVALPGLTDKAKKLAIQYKIGTIEAVSPENATAALKQALAHK